MEAAFREALAYQRAGRLEEAEALYRRIQDWRPEWTLGNLGVILRTTGRLEEAEAAFRAALQIDPANAHLRHSLGMTLLQAGQYAEGWRLYEARHELLPRPTAPFREWRGEDLSGKHLLVLAEQGLGDQILWSRFLPLVAERAATVSLGAPQPLVRLFGGLAAKVFHPRRWDDDVDVWASIGSVARWLEAAPADAPLPALRAAGQRASTARLGLMLSGGAANPNSDRIPPPNVGRAIRGLAEFVDLAPEVTGAADLAETAGIIAGLDAVVTVDTSVAHLAGSLGKPCYILAPRPAMDWYTRWESDRTPWYPSARVIRQRSRGDWSSVIADLADALARPAVEQVVIRPGLPSA